MSQTPEKSVPRTQPTRGGLFSVADLKSGFLVSLIALPLCLGIAVASGFPPIAGVMTAVIGGLVVGVLSGAPLSIKGPAAGLIVIAVGAVHDLGGGDLAVGYRRALAVGIIAAAIQIVLALGRAASIGVIMSPSVVHGMLAAIGVTIIAKQVHVALGVTSQAKGPLGSLAEIPASLARANPVIALIGVLALIVLFGMPLIKARWARVVPAPLVVLAIAIPIGLLAGLSGGHDYHLLSGDFHLGPEFLVRLPASLSDAFVGPDFSVILSATSIQYIVMFALIGTIESTLTVLAVDAMDRGRRAGDVNRDLLAVGTGNLLSSFLGGLPMISEIVRSRANVDAGARTRWSNVAHGGYLLIFVAVIPGVVQTIPLAALAAMLVHTGTRLASPREFAHARLIGLDQLALFLTTLIVTLATDLLIGVAAGLALEVVLHLKRGVSPLTLLRPRTETIRTDGTLRVRVPDAAVFPALLPVRKAVNRAITDGRELSEIVVDVRNTRVVDHTFQIRLDDMAKELPSGTNLTVEGLDALRSVAAHPHATRLGARA